MKRIRIDKLELILENTHLFVMRKKLVQITLKDWIVESYKENVCSDITLDCEVCPFYKEEKCIYKI